LGFLREPPSWRLARKRVAAGADDANLVLWQRGGRPPRKIAVFDPSGRLPKNMLSWA